MLSTRAKTLQEAFRDKIIFIGPDLDDANSLYFKEDDELLKDWRAHAADKDGLAVRIGRWNVPGEPLTVLVGFDQYYKDKNEIYTWLWEHYGVDSLHAYGDYDEASMFSYGAAKVVESFYNFYLDESKKVVYHGNEWMTGLGLLYLNNKAPSSGNAVYDPCHKHRPQHCRQQ